MLNAAVLSFWHVHAHDYAREFLTFPDTRIAAVWDELPERGRKEAAQYGADFHASLDEILARPDIDCVLVTTPTNLHRDVMVKAARAGKHIYTEKVLATTLAEADQILAAVREAGVHFIISYPRRSEPQWMLAKQLVDQGVLGRVTYMRTRWAHTGASDGWLPPHFYNAEQCGGGALIDLGAHPMYLTSWILGRPERISSTFSSVLNKGVEDNVVVTMAYADGALAVAETGFVSATPAALEVHGTEGVLYAGGPEDRVLVRSRVWERALGVQGWVTPNLPQADRTPMCQFIEAVREGKPMTIRPEEARDLTELMEAAYRSAAAGRQVALGE